MRRVTFNNFAAKGWKDKVLDADQLWAQVESGLSRHGQTLPQTPRRPDVRLILENISGQELTFKNPGNHSSDNPEIIPADGDKRAVMVMLAGETLAEQHRNAAQLVKRFNLGAEGLSPDFIAALGSGALKKYVTEAYGPAPFSGQADKLVPLDWKKEDGATDRIAPVRHAHAAYGARAETQETVFIAQFQIFVRGTGTTAELMEGGSMAIAVASDWQTSAVTTRPIVPSVARTYYGAHFDSIPTAIVHPDGQVRNLSLPQTKSPQAPAHKEKPAAP